MHSLSCMTKTYRSQLNGHIVPVAGVWSESKERSV